MRDPAGVRRRQPTGKPCHRKIEAAPKEMHRAAFAAKPRAKFFEDTIGLNKCAPEPVRVFRIVRPMHLVFVERNRIGNFVRQVVDLHGQLELIERAHHCFVEVGDTLRPELDCFDRAIVFQNEQIVIDKIEIDLERVVRVRDWRRAKAARSQIKCDVPGMIDPRRQHESDFADDLRPHMKRGAGLFPICVIQLGPIHTIFLFRFLNLNLSRRRFRPRGRLSINVIAK